MTTPSGPGEDRAGWERLWPSQSEANRRNPAQTFRRRLLFSEIADGPGGLRILDIGSGQGDFLAEARRRFPAAQLAGVDGSHAGLDITRAKVKDARLFRADFESDALPDELRGFATHAVCSEVLEHLDRPEVLLRSARSALAPEGRLIVTVPAGPFSANDVHLGHRRHYTPRALEALLGETGYERLFVHGAGFPFFNLYRLALCLRGSQIVRDAENPGASPVVALGMAVFDQLLRLNYDRSRLGWQVFGVFRVR